MPHDHFDPPGLFSTQGLGFTHVVTSAPGTTIHSSGQRASNAERKLARGNDVAFQPEQAFGNLRIALEAAGAGALTVPGFRIEVEATVVVAA